MGYVPIFVGTLDAQTSFCGLFSQSCLAKRHNNFRRRMRRLLRQHLFSFLHDSFSPVGASSAESCDKCARRFMGVTRNSRRGFLHGALRLDVAECL
jgi:hypothetical protein